MLSAHPVPLPGKAGSSKSYIIATTPNLQNPNPIHRQAH